ncbi:hypothetical protein ACTXT7_007759 [Hymenolepis weldensis]
MAYNLVPPQNQHPSGDILIQREPSKKNYHSTALKETSFAAPGSQSNQAAFLLVKGETLAVLLNDTKLAIFFLEPSSSTPKKPTTLFAGDQETEKVQPLMRPSEWRPNPIPYEML